MYNVEKRKGGLSFMEGNNATIAAIIAAIAAIVAPVITSIVSGVLENRRHKRDIALSKVQMIYPAKQKAYQELAAELSRLVDSNGSSYDRIKLIALLNQALLLSDEKTEAALIEVRNVCFRGDSPWTYSADAIKQMNRELRDTRAQI